MGSWHYGMGLASMQLFENDKLPTDNIKLSGVRPSCARKATYDTNVSLDSGREYFEILAR